MTTPYLLTDFNLTLSGSELVGIEWYRQAWKEKHLHFWNPNHPEYCQEFVDEWELLDEKFTATRKTYEVNFK